MESKRISWFPSSIFDVKCLSLIDLKTYMLLNSHHWINQNDWLPAKAFIFIVMNIYSFIPILVCKIIHFYYESSQMMIKQTFVIAILYTTTIKFISLGIWILIGDKTLTVFESFCYQYLVRLLSQRAQKLLEMFEPM